VDRPHISSCEVIFYAEVLRARPIETANAKSRAEPQHPLARLVNCPDVIVTESTFVMNVVHFHGSRL